MRTSIVHAGTLSFIESLVAKVASASGVDNLVYNSQNMPLLAAAINVDPSAATGGGDITVEGSALVPQEGPSGTAADIVDRPSASQISVYIVRKNDTLSSIATMFGVNVNTIVWANDIHGGVIHEGESLIILPINGIKHTIVKGDTLASLAKAYKSDVHDIASYNNLADDAALAPGQSVIIPNGEVTATPTTPSPASIHRSKINGIAKGKIIEPYLGGSGPAIAGYFVWPVAGGVITQGLHGWNAVDIGAPRGTAIYAAADGVVIIAKGGGGWNGGYGNYVVIQHPNGTQTLYGHASVLLVSAGDQVAQGQTIAKIGTTGMSTGPHLHFEVRGAANPFAN